MPINGGSTDDAEECDRPHLRTCSERNCEPRLPPCLCRCLQFNSIKLEGLVLVRHLILVHHRRPEGWLVPTDGA